ncbi:MAG TPA: RNB domain-containing ribonuclease [Solirubrobacteraceae bacterium]|nr:RNB domain-containing ribonuclease [Solirubrobacteraceae bacterium]
MSADPGPAPADAFVAVLERRGRFLVAEPLFPQRVAGGDGAGHASQRRRSARLTLGPARAHGGRVRAGAGELALVQAPARGGGARVLRALGRPDVARDVIEALLLDRGLARGFHAEVEAEAARAAGHAHRAGGERRDLTALPTFTIDPASARDFDDAISAEPLGGGTSGEGRGGGASAEGRAGGAVGKAGAGGEGRAGGAEGKAGAGAEGGAAAGDGAIRVWVHIADVAAHVPEGSALDREARRRATSVYAPGAVEPMLPHALSSDACSLLPGRERAAVTVELELHGAGIARASFYRSLVRSDARLDYEQVDRVFAGRERAAEPWGAALAAARAAAAALQRERERKGALAVESEEPEFRFDEHGHVVEVLPRAQTESHRLIEHLMIAANEAVAQLLARRGVPCLYRVHERPEPERVRRLADQLASLQVPTPPLPERMSSTQAGELVGEISQLVERHVRRTGHGRQALGALVLRSLMQACYSPKNLGHAGLRSDCYCHFTSPIRRYPDLVCHRALLSAVGRGEPPPRAGEMAELGAWTSEREREAMLIERDADDVARCFALARLLRSGDPQQRFAGEVTGLISAGAFVSFSGAGAPAAQFEGMLPVRRLRAGDGDGERDWWELNEHGTILHGERTGSTLRLGDPVCVLVEGVDSIRGRVDLTPAVEAPPERRGGARKGGAHKNRRTRSGQRNI